MVYSRPKTDMSYTVTYRPTSSPATVNTTLRSYKLNWRRENAKFSRRPSEIIWRRFVPFGWSRPYVYVLCPSRLYTLGKLHALYIMSLLSIGNRTPASYVMCWPLGCDGLCTPRKPSLFRTYDTFGEKYTHVNVLNANEFYFFSAGTVTFS